MNNKLEVIGIDHGWSMMKTISQVFVTGVKEITTTPALFGDVLEYEGKFYKVGTVRQEVKDTKVEDDSFYLLTLAAVAKELKRRGLAEAKVFLAVGLPLTRFGAEKNDFIKYLTKNKRVSFKYENEPYYIEMDDVAVFPQCYAAVVDKIPTMAKKTLIVDIGSWTIDIMPVINKSPDESKCVTIPKGLITCMRSINEQCVRQLNGEVDESEIQNIMRYGRSDIDDEYFAIIKAEIEDFVDKVYNSIREFGYNLKTTPIVFVGGGAVVMKNFGSHDAKNISYNLDVKANARGYANEKIVFQLINTEQNKTFLEQVPHREFQDLSIVYKVIISADKDAVQSSKITNEFAKRLGMSEEQLFKCAAENTRRLFPPVVRSMNDIMREMFARDGMPQEIADMMIAEIPPEQTMWVISNEKGINGAASMLYENELHELAESLESDLYILPSSVHEVIAVSSDMGSPEMLAQMVVEVNMQEVSLDERLSNQVYHYDKDLRKLTLATDTPNKRLDGIVAEPPLVYDAREKTR